MNENPSNTPPGAPDPAQTPPPQIPSFDQEPATQGAPSPVVGGAGTMTAPNTLAANTQQPQPVQPSSELPSPAPEQPNPKKLPKKNFIILAIIVGALLLLAAGASVYAFWYQNPDRVVAQAMHQMLRTDSASTTTRITSDSELAPGFINIKIKELTVDTAGNKATGDMAASLTLELNGRDYSLGGKARVLDDASVYFQINEYSELLDQVVKDFAGDEQVIPSDVMTELGSVENKWVKVTPADIGERGDSYQCAIDSLKRVYETDEFDEQLVAAYDSNRFITIKDSVTSKDGNLGYRVELNQDALRAFGEELESTKLYEDLKRCETVEPAENDMDPGLESANDTAPKVDIIVWVSRFGHELTQIDYTITAESTGNNEAVVFEGKTSFDYADVTVAAPESSMTYSEWMQSIEDLQTAIQKAYLGNSSLQSLDGADFDVTGRETARRVMLKAESYNAVIGKYPTADQLLTGNPAVPEANLDAELAQRFSTAAPTADRKDTIQYVLCSHGAGSSVSYYDTAKKSVESYSFGLDCSSNT